jgi:RNA polymerase sigma-70 factor (ECF subfamily)
MRFKGGDLSAFEELVVKYQDRIYNLCRYTLGNDRDADDAAQDTFIKSYRGLKDFKPKKPFYTWLYRIAVNTCLDYRRKSASESFHQSRLPDAAVLSAFPASEPSPEKLYELKETGKTLELALAKLPRKLRTVIILREIEQLTYEEIAEIMNSSMGTVKSRISRAREMLRDLLIEKV